MKCQTNTYSTIAHVERIHPAIFPGLTEVAAMPMRVRSLRRDELDMWYDNGRDGVWQGRLKFGSETATTTYHSHEFYFTVVGDENNFGRLIPSVYDGKVLQFVAACSFALMQSFNSMITRSSKFQKSLK